MLDTDWKRILTIGYSSLAFYLLAIFTVAPDVIYVGWGIDTNPKTWGLLQLGAIMFGLVGRLVQQPPEGRWLRRALIAAAMLVVAFFAYPAMAMSALPADAEPRVAASQPDDFDQVSFELISRWEGKRNTAYLDIVGVPTICFGHTRTVTRADVANGRTMTDAQCRTLLIEEIHEYRENLHGYFTIQTVTERLTPARDAAYTSLAFNVGWHGAGKSTATKRLNRGDIAGGCEALTWWNKAGGRVVRGLVNRRNEERRLCLQGVS